MTPVSAQQNACVRCGGGLRSPAWPRVRRVGGLGLVGLLLGVLTAPLAAQVPVTNAIFTVGTSARGLGADWSYVFLNVPPGGAGAGRSWAIFAKAGRPADPGTFSRRGTIERQTSVGAIGALLQQSRALGQDLVSLSNTLNIVLRGVPGVAGQSTEQKILTAFQAAATNRDVADRVLLLTRGHPGLALCSGRAFSEVITGVTTYEVRELDRAAVGAVVGRVILDPANVPVLPAPGRPVQVTTNDRSDHLVIRLRWGIPLDLRQVSPLGYGYNVWRVPKAVAEQANWQNVPPTRAQLLSHPDLRRINEAPTMATRLLAVGSGPGAADDPSDRITSFYSDHNGSAGRAFEDGEAFYYFVTARDLLGRDGLVSLGGQGRACRRVTPAPPRDLLVANAVIPGSTNARRLQVDWEQNTNATDRVTEYWVYRWSNPTMVQTNDRVPLEHRIQVVAAISGTNRNAFLDTTPGAFTVPSPSNIWYTIRAVSQAACGPLLSGHSAPASGVLRDWTAPDAPTGTLVGSCGSPMVVVDRVQTNAYSSPAPGERRYRFTCVRRDRSTAWVEFFVPENREGVVTSAVPRIYFPPGGDRVAIDYTRRDAIGGAFALACTVGNVFGRVTAAPAVYRVNSPLEVDRQLEVDFLAGQVLGTTLAAGDRLLTAALALATNAFPATVSSVDASGMVSLGIGFALAEPVLLQAQVKGVWSPVSVVQLDASGRTWIRYPECLTGPIPPFRASVLPSGLLDAGDCSGHMTSAGDGTVAPINSRVLLTPGTEEYRLYRQTDGGPLTLIAQGEAKYAPSKILEIPDALMPVSPARLCYFVQLLDEHGNGSPLSPLGCRDVLPEKAPRPVLSEPLPAGNVSQPQVALKWSCPPAGVVRFKIGLRKLSGETKPGNGLTFTAITAPGLIRDTAFARSAVFTGLGGMRTVALTAAGGAPVGTQFDEVYDTPRVGNGLGAGPEFSYTLNIPAGVTYQISVAPVFPGAEATEFSEAWDFVWKAPALTPAPQDVPWPARPLPRVGAFHPGIGVARVTTENTDSATKPRWDFPIGVRIGVVRNPTIPGGRPGFSRVAAWPLLDRFLLFAPTGPGDASGDPNGHMFTRQDGLGAGAAEPLLPVALYRQQVTNAAFPRVSGDVTQVSPLIERVAVRKDVLNNGYTQFEVLDPLITGSIENGPVPGLPPLQDPVMGGDNDCGIYLVDSQPMVAGAAYRYFLARFKANREIAEIIPAGEIVAPDN